MTGKTRKAIIKRLKLTRRGKMVHRPPGQDHFLAKRRRNLKQRLHGRKNLSPRVKRAVVRQLYY